MESIGRTRWAIAEGYIPAWSHGPDLTDPEPVPRGTPYASVIRSDVPIVVQHTRIDTRQAEAALMSTVAYSE